MKWIAALTATLSAAAATTGVATQPAAAAAAPVAYAGMTITQGSALCTLGYVDPYTRQGFAAGHCRQSEIVTNEDGQFIGTVVKGLSMVGDTAADFTMDYELIALDPSVTVVSDPYAATAGPLDAYTGIRPEHGMTVCHDGATTGHSCGKVVAVHDGWFSMLPGTGDLTSDHGDSGGPVYAFLPGNPNRVLLGIFEGRRGNLYAAVNWTQIQAMI